MNSDSPQARTELANLAAEPHGGPDGGTPARRGKPASWLDFSVCVNPYGPAPGVMQAIAAAAIDCYPDRDCRRLRAALAETLDVPPARILIGNGSSELIGLAALAYLRPGERVLVLGPTYGEYARAARIAGAEVVAVDGIAADSEAVAKGLQDRQPRLVFLCNPNNPTGTLLPGELLAAWAARHPGSLFVVDEAYIAFATGMPSAVALNRPNILVLRSLTKDHALAGIRLGYAVGPEPVIDALSRVRMPWSVSTIAQAAGLACLQDRAHLEQSLRSLALVKKDLVDGIRQLGLAVLPSATHYFLVEVGDGAACRDRLLERGILVRDTASFGLPTQVRISTRLPEDNQRLLAALSEIWRTGGCAELARNSAPKKN